MTRQCVWDVLRPYACGHLLSAFWVYAFPRIVQSTEGWVVNILNYVYEECGLTQCEQSKPKTEIKSGNEEIINIWILK